MAQPADRALLDALGALAAALAELGAPAMVIGGIAVIARGVPRQTVDVDATVWAEALDLDALLAALARHHVGPRIADAAAFARQHQVLLLRHGPSGTPVEVTLAWLPFEREAIGRATPVDFGGVTIAVAAPEDLVVYKTIAWRERDRADVERLLALHGDRLDLHRIRSAVERFTRTLQDPDRLRAFDALVARARTAGSEPRERGSGGSPMTQTSPLFRWDGTYWGFLLEDRLYDRHGHHVGWLERAPRDVDVFDRSGRFLGQLVDGRYVLRSALREEPVHRAPRPAIPDAVPPAPEPDHSPRAPREHWRDALPWPLRRPDPPSL